MKKFQQDSTPKPSGRPISAVRGGIGSQPHRSVSVSAVGEGGAARGLAARFEGQQLLAQTQAEEQRARDDLRRNAAMEARRLREEAKLEAERKAKLEAEKRAAREAKEREKAIKKVRPLAAARWCPDAVVRIPVTRTSL